MKKLSLFFLFPFLFGCQSNAFNSTYTPNAEAVGQYQKLKSKEMPHMEQVDLNSKREEEYIKKGYVIIGRATTEKEERVPRTFVYDMAKSKDASVVILKSGVGERRTQTSSRMIKQEKQGNFVKTTYLNSFYNVEYFNEEAVFLAKRK